ncbi:hypothetical protein DES36_11541 [Alkalibaculum bacchi]|uniref:Uncharacterized protein n=2 Tax=Alkalibaculum bacchi TaxID=645887 RepID=A0A366I0Z0_9FIRM|nr:hypothetical protein DES36_11541 [Alkalibaculum bacchi]
MLNWYKNWREKIRTESVLKGLINMNTTFIKRYKSGIDEVYIFEGKKCISVRLKESLWEEVSQLGVRRNLWDKHVMSYDVAIREYDKLKEVKKKRESNIY